ncbi:unnamed protein product [Cyprideis torosa]|uniref:Uncharacterized protein n=1 Tax=Cyprideis torosa TaxID=163714 RepID=A0A7R8X0S2_9CRUS|nr:unnamed protein product [Cyprideis torosa]CAG0909979.1 unnamed protein product [Cyprideis torosa]
MDAVITFLNTQENSTASAQLSELVSLAKESIETQALELTRMAARLGEELEKAVQLILQSNGRVILCGMGKSGLVGKKISATLASTGTPSFFIHPADAFHGDLGMITPQDVVILISNSGETEEIIKLLPSLHYLGNETIALSGNPESTIALQSTVFLNTQVEREVCPNNLAPTTSTLVTMAMGDALAVTLIKARNFKPVDFARFHPGGSLGRKLLTRVRDVMHTRLPIVSPDANVKDCLFTMTSGRLGIALIMSGEELLGIVTDGDLRRAMLKDDNLMSKPAVDIATSNPLTISSEIRLSEAEAIMHKEKIRVLVVKGSRGNEQKVVGVLEIFD